MIAVTQVRTVLVVGRKATAAPALLPVAEGSTGILVCTVGWPLTAVQQALVDRAIEVAREARVILEAVLVASPNDAAQHCRPGDEVRLCGTRREFRRLGRTLATAGVAATQRVTAPGAR